jgi:hypothetical protein
MDRLPDEPADTRTDISGVLPSIGEEVDLQRLHPGSLGPDLAEPYQRVTDL